MSDSVNITWIPEHKSAASHSMRRYWMALAEAWLPEDRYTPVSTMDPSNENRKSGLWGRAYRAWQRSVVYPNEIQRRTKGTLVHVLDHSWTDMLKNVPGNVKKIVTVHDLIPLRSSAGLSGGQLKRFRERLSMLGSVDAIIADSNFTKADIIDFFNIAESKIHVVPIGVDVGDLGSSPVWTAVKNDELRIGSIGTVLPRKNLAILPQVLSELKRLTPYKIILERVGQTLPAELAAQIKCVIGDSSLIESEKISDEGVRKFYGRQDVIAFPSLFEGFGLPVLEGMAAGIPVVSSSSSSLPEVGGNHVLYFDPENPVEMARQLAKVASGELPAGWTSSARKHAATFTWRRTLEDVYAVYDLVL